MSASMDLKDEAVRHSKALAMEKIARAKAELMVEESHAREKNLRGLLEVAWRERDAAKAELATEHAARGDDIRSANAEIAALKEREAWGD